MGDPPVRRDVDRVLAWAIFLPAPALLLAAALEFIQRVQGGAPLSIAFSRCLLQPEAWLFSLLFVGLALLARQPASRRLLTGVANLSGLYLVLERPIYQHFGAHLSFAQWQQTASLAHLADSIVAEVDLVQLVLLSFWALGLVGSLYFLRRLRPDAMPNPALRWWAAATGLFVIYASALVLWLNPGTPEHPLRVLLWPDALAPRRVAVETLVADLQHLRFGTATPTPPEQVKSLRALIPGAKDTKPNIVLVVLESSGALQVLKNGRFDPAITPTLASLQSRGGALFDQVYGSAPSSLPSALELNTGGQVPTWQSPVESVALPWSGPLLVNALADGGYRTALFAAPDLDYLGLSKFLGQGRYQRLVHFGSLSSSEQATEKLNGWGGRDDVMFRRAAQWAVEQKSGVAPFFLHVMSNAPHHPYKVPADVAALADGRAARYRQSLKFADAAVGELLAEINRSGNPRETVFVLTGDHGEGLGDGVGGGHLPRFSESALRTFVLISSPRQTPQRVDRVAAVGDVMPTVLDLAGLPTPASVVGQSLLAANWSPRLHFFSYEQRSAAWGVRDGQWKFVSKPDGTAQLIDLNDVRQPPPNVAGYYSERVALYQLLAGAWFLKQDQAWRDGQRGGGQPDPAKPAGNRTPVLKDMARRGAHSLQVSFLERNSPLAFELRPAERFNPRERLFVDILWMGFASEELPTLFWHAPSGKIHRQDIATAPALHRQSVFAALPESKETGNWRLEIMIDDVAFAEAAFTIDPGVPLRGRPAAEVLAPAARARIDRLEVGRVGGDHAFEAQTRFAPDRGFTLRATWRPGLRDAQYAYRVYSPRGETLRLPILLPAGSLYQDKVIQPPSPLWPGKWRVELVDDAEGGPSKVLAEVSFEVAG